MFPIRTARVRLCLMVGTPLLAWSCRSPAPASVAVASAGNARVATSPERNAGHEVLSNVRQISHVAAPPAAPSAGFEPPTAGYQPLPLDALVAEVLTRNPTLQAAVAAWQAASQRYPQVVALDDPMFETMLAPAGLASDEVDGAFMVGVSQKIPWHGKRQLRGQIASWDYNAAKWDSRDVQLQLTEATKLAYFEYYLVHRQLEVNAANTAFMDQFQDIARARYETNQAPQQDVLQADVELAELSRREVELQQRYEVAVARINTLLHRQPDAPLTPPPSDLPVSDEVHSVDLLRQAAIQQRPDLAALASRIQSERSAVELACKEFYPDLELIARYDAFWQEQPLRPMIGFNVNIPLNHDKRRAAVNEALFRLSKMQAEYAQQVDAVQRDVQSTRAKLVESRKAVALYSQRILPAAEANVQSARAGYETGQVDFLRLIEARRQLNDLQEQMHEAVAEYHARLAELERTVGGNVLR